MYWDTFKEFMSSHPSLVPCLEEQLQVFSDGRPLQYIVEQQLDYVTVRPWESLNLGARGNFHTFNKQKEGSVLYTVYAHIEGNEEPCTRARMSYQRVSSSVEELIREYKEWHLEYWAKQDDRPLVFDAVTRRNQLVQNESGNPFIDRKTLSFYLFPEGFAA